MGMNWLNQLIDRDREQEQEHLAELDEMRQIQARLGGCVNCSMRDEYAGCLAWPPGSCVREQGG